MSESKKKGKILEEYNEVLRQALEMLFKPPSKLKYGEGIHHVNFRIHGKETDALFPIDDDAPFDKDIESYIYKQMEYVECFLVAERLAKELEIGKICPLSFEPTKYIEVILSVVGRGSDVTRESEDLRYYPQPHMPIKLNTPFIDFAAFMVVILTDFLKWSGNVNNPISEIVKAEIDTAIDFILSADTIISYENGAGWGFVPKIFCDTRKGADISGQRHILPTAWAIVALEKYLSLSDIDSKRKKMIDEILPKVFKWIKILCKTEHLFLSNEKQISGDLAGHNYATESLLTLEQLDLADVEDLAILALESFVNELDKEDSIRNFEVNIAYPINIKGKQQVVYPDHTTWANCLSTLALGVNFLTKKTGEKNVDDLIVRARTHCNIMARHIIKERRDRNGLWQENRIQFHWTLTAIESLLRVSRYAKLQTFETSTDAVIQAVQAVINDRTFIESMQEAMLNALTRSSKVIAPMNDDD